MFAFYPPHHSNYVYTPYQPRFYKPVSPIARSRNESYYAPTTPMYDLVIDLNEQEQQRRAQEAVQQKQQERHERENQVRQRAYRQWLHEKEATREAMKPFEQRTPPHLCPSNNDINLNKSPRIRRIPIQSSSNNNRYTQKEAAKRIIGFIRHHRENSITRRALHKLRELRIIEQQLYNLDTQSISSLTLSFDEHGMQVLPNTPDNKMFIRHEEAILKILDQLDRIDSNGLEAVRERRKKIVMIAQKMLDDLDSMKNEQWSKFNNKDIKEINAGDQKFEEKFSLVGNNLKNLAPTQKMQNKIEQETITPYIITESTEVPLSESME